jgi:8-oxo-dGTP pyrophosphatase MutT (NUDIX family)
MSLDGTPDDYVDRIAARLSRSEPIEKVPGGTAGVAVIFGRAGSFVLIKRVERPDDPWSGQVAFPGGRVQAGDASFFETACREAQEEVGLDLRANARFLGYMENFEPGNRRVSVVPCVFQLTEEGVVVQNSEVSSHRWVPLGSVSVSNRDEYIFERGDRRLALPAFRFRDYLVWGLTERILTKLVELVGMVV